MAIIEIGTIQATSATLAETMRLCSLRSGLSRSEGSANYVLSNPKIWLGIAYHSVLEKIVQTDATSTPIDVSAALLWEEAVKSQHTRAAAHPLDHRFGSPTTWPGYHVARASVVLRAQELAVRAKLTAQQNTTIPVSSTDLTIRERKFVAYGDKLVGRPDVIRTKEIVDYKTGGVTEYDDSQKEVVKASYIRQLRIYGYLVRENLGWWPERGMLFPMIGPGIEIALTPADCEREAAEAVALLDAYNATIVSDDNLISLAQPSVRACKWCSYKAVCPAFWERASPEWSAVLDDVAAEGVITDIKFIHGGAAVAITMEIERGTKTPHSVQIAPLNPAIHTYVTSLMKSEKIRVIGLRARPDGALAPTQRTIVFPMKDIPSLQRAVGSAPDRTQL